MDLYICYMAAIEKKIIYSYSFWSPPIETFALLNQSGSKLCIEAQENYQKRSWRNRTIIMGPQGRQLLSVPLKKGKNNKMPIRSVKISQDEDWKRLHLKTIQNNYQSAPYFDHYFPKVVEQYQKNYRFLWNWNLDWIHFWKENLDFRFRVEKTDTFGSPEGAFKANDEKERNSLELHCMKSFWYPQVFEEEHGFAKNVSIMDMLFCTGPETRSYLNDFFYF